MTFRWKNPRRAIYRSLTWQTEVYVVRPATFPSRRKGVYSYVDYQFARRFHAGVRGDVSDPWGESPYLRGALGYLTFTPSEFMLLSGQVRRQETAASSDWSEFLKLTFNIGPHGA